MAGRIIRGGGRAAPRARTPAAKAGNRRTAEDVAKLVPTFVKHLKAGGTMKALKDEHGFSDDGPIRAALYRAGYDSKGAEHGTEENCFANLSPAKLRDKLVELRGDGHPWYALAYVSGKTEAEVKQIVADAGGPTGRVYVKTEKEEKPRAARAARRAGRAKTATAVDPS